MPKDRNKTRFNAKVGRRLLADIHENGFAWNEYGTEYSGKDPTAVSAMKNIAFPKRRERYG